MRGLRETMCHECGGGPKNIVIKAAEMNESLFVEEVNYLRMPEHERFCRALTEIRIDTNSDDES